METTKTQTLRYDYATGGYQTRTVRILACHEVSITTVIDGRRQPVEHYSYSQALQIVRDLLARGFVVLS